MAKKTFAAELNEALHSIGKEGLPRVRRVSLTQDLKDRALAEGVQGMLATPECMATTEQGHGIVRFVFADVLVNMNTGEVDIVQPVKFSKDGPTSQRVRSALRGATIPKGYKTPLFH